jgi:hypothetical protein
LDADLATKRIAIQFVRYWSYWREPTGEVLISVLGRAGWFHIQPAQEYRKIFYDITEGVDLLYFFAHQTDVELYRKPAFATMDNLCFAV